jgi:DegV family protein with EDD domain
VILFLIIVTITNYKQGEKLMVDSVAQRVINGNDILKWFYLGAQEVQLNKKYLNSINLFPVADGDTGTNLSTTMKAMVENVENDQSFHAVIRTMSESGLAHARGNSGILFASYIKGLAVEGRIFDAVTIKDFSTIAHQAVKYLYQAIDNPMEGTMISVIKDWATFLYYNCERYDSFSELLKDAYQTAGISLQRTATQLDVLKKHHVVDSGAEGFVRFLNGINRYFTGAQIEVSTPWSGAELAITEEHVDQYQYCTELFLELSKKYEKEPNNKLDRRIKSILHKFGDSLIVSSQGNKLRVHIHTDYPELVADTMRFYGTFLEQKVDNMKLQNSVKAHQLSNIAIVTDSIADLPEEYKLEHQIHTLPLGLLMDESLYLDKLTIKLGQLFPIIPKLSTYPTSSQPEPGRTRAFLENLLDTYDSLIFIAVSSKLSGTYQTVARAAEELRTEGKLITIIDSLLNSGAQGLLVKTAADLLEAGYSHSDIVSELQRRIPNTKIYVCLNTLEYAIRSGRVPNTVGKIGMKLGLRPIMTLDDDGKGAAFGAAFSRHGITKKIYKLVEKAIREGGIKDYCIVHADNLSLAIEYQKELTKQIGKEPAFISEISSIVAIHSGPGCVAVCFTTE